MSSVSAIPPSSFISGGSGGDDGVTVGSGSKVQQLQQKIQKVLEEIKELIDSEDMSMEVKQKLIQAKQMQIHVYQAQIVMIQSQEAQEANMEAIKEVGKMVEGLETSTADVTKPAPKTMESVISHIGENKASVADSIKESAEQADKQTQQARKQEDNDPFLRGPRRPINEYV